MGPVALVDKSFLQSLSRDLVFRLFLHYSLCIPRVLVMEIQGDLSKTPKPGKKSAEEDVKDLANKILGGDSYVCTYYRKLSIVNLLGADVDIQSGQVPVDTDVPVKGSDGKTGVMIEQSREMGMVRRWQDGEFTDLDRKTAADYRGALSDLNLEKVKLTVNAATPKLVLKGLDEVIRYVDQYLESPDRKDHLENYLEMIHASDELKKAAYNRWLAKKMPPLKTFAPYAHFCYRINLMFMVGVLTGNIPTRASNVIDIEYLYYLPFCWVFVSGDNLHRDLVPYFQRADQVFVRGEEMRNDLKLLEDAWNALSEKEKEAWAVDYGSYPPQDDKYLAHRIWKKYMKPWSPGSGNIISRLTEEQKAKIIEEVQKKLGPYFKGQRGLGR